MFRKNLAIFVVCFSVVVLMSVPVGAISEGQKNAIIDNCVKIRDDLKTLQHNDSRARVYLGRYYETILTKFIMPLNVRLTENMLSSDSFVNNQNDFAKTRTNFVVDFVEYQKRLESLVGIDCRTEPEKFYSELKKVRTWRETVAEDVVKLRKLVGEQMKLVDGLKEKL